MMKRRVVIFFLLAAAVSLFGSSVEERLAKIPAADREKINGFFEIAVKFNHVGHVLYFDNKPMSLIGFMLSEDIDEDLIEGWNVFKKHLWSFPSKKFLLNENVRIFPTGKFCHIFLINKPFFLKCIQENQQLFEKVMKCNIDGNTMLKELEKGRPLIELIQHNDLLLGVLLGYGVESAKLYTHMQSAEDPSSLPDGSYIGYSPDMVDGMEIYPVGFMGSIHSKEAKKISRRFEKEWISLNQILKEKQGDPTRFFLEAFCKE